jgi:hypothetical protein
MKGDKQKVRGMGLLRSLEKKLVEYYGKVDPADVPSGWKEFPQVYQCYGPREGCVNEGCSLYSDDTLQAIINLLRTYFEVINKKLDEVFHLEGANALQTAVEPNYEDTSYVVIFSPTAHKVIQFYVTKAWHHQFETPEEVAEDLYDSYKTMKQNWLRV